MTAIRCSTSWRYVSKKKIDELFYELPNMFGIADDIFIARSDDMGRDYDATLDKVLRICRQANLKLNKVLCKAGVSVLPDCFNIASRVSYI